jgi:transcriptional regulator with XRE-family HTH domain
MSGLKIKSYRENSGFRQSDIANFLGIDQSLVSMIEKDKRALTSDMLEKLAELFGIQVSDFEEGDFTAKPLSLALRSNKFASQDLETLRAINRIALNCNFMTNLLEGDLANG